MNERLIRICLSGIQRTWASLQMYGNTRDFFLFDMACSTDILCVLMYFKFSIHTRKMYFLQMKQIESPTELGMVRSGKKNFWKYY